MNLIISILLGISVTLILLTIVRLIRLSYRSRFELLATSTTCSTTSTSSTHPPYEEGDYCDAEYGGVVSGRVAPRECSNFQNIARGIAHAGFTSRQAAEAIAAMGRAGASAGREFQRLIREFEGGIVSEYDMGYVNNLTITMRDGQEISIENARVELYIEQERLDHYSGLSGDRVRDRSVVVNETRRARVGVREDQFFEAIRLIRED